MDIPTAGPVPGPHRETIGKLCLINIARRRRPIGSQTCTTQLRVVINRTLSSYQPGSRTILYDTLVPTDANVRIARHSANVNGVPTRRQMFRFAPDNIEAQSGHAIGSADARFTLAAAASVPCQIIPRARSYLVPDHPPSTNTERFTHSGMILP